MDGLLFPFQGARHTEGALGPQSKRQDSNRALERVAVRQDSGLQCPVSTSLEEGPG